MSLYRKLRGKPPDPDYDLWLKSHHREKWEAVKEYLGTLLLIWAIPFIAIIAYGLLKLIGMAAAYILTHQ